MVEAFVLQGQLYRGSYVVVFMGGTLYRGQAGIYPHSSGVITKASRSQVVVIQIASEILGLN